MDPDDVAALDEQVASTFEANLNAERAVIGAMLASPDAVWTAQQILRPDDFTDGRNATLARIIVGIVSQGGTADPVTVSDAIERQGLGTQTGGGGYLFELSAWSPANVEHYAEIVRDRAIRRALREAGRAIFDEASGELSGSAAAERARVILDRATSRTARRVEVVGADVTSFVDELETHAEHYSSPWPSLDRITGGFAPGRLYVIAARPGSGKTLMGVQIAAELTRFGAVAYSSLEMERREILGRLFSTRGQVPLRDLNGGTPSDWTWRQVAKLRSEISEMPLFVDDASDVYIADVHAHARAVARRQPLAGVVIDYLGLLSIPQDGKRSRWEHFTEISHQLKRMAKSLRVPVIALQQLGRGMESESRVRPPTLSDIRDSGSIEQDADVVALLHRATDDPKNAPLTLHVHVAKNRHGPTESFRLGWRGETATLSEIAHPELEIPGEDQP